MPIEDLSYFQEKEFKRKLALYEQMLQNGQSVYLEADELTDIAEYYQVQDEKEKAMQCIDYALSIHPGSIDPLIFLARQKMFSGDLKGAQTIRDCITDQNDREVIFLNAELLLREDKETEAEEYLAEIAEREEDDKALFAYDTACLFLDYDALEHVAKWGKYALDLEPDNENFLKLKADYLIASNRPQEAITILNDLLDANPYNVNLWNTLGEAYFVNEDYEKTLEAADFALAIDEQDAQALLLKANSQMQQQNFEEAHMLYTRYIEKNKSNELPYLFDGICLSSMELYPEALTQLQKADELSQGYSPEQQHIYSNLSEVYSKLHQEEKALEYVDKIKSIIPDYNTNLYKGHILLENGRKKEGIAYYETYIQDNDDATDAHFLVGMALMDNKSYNEAKKHFLIVQQRDKANNTKDRDVYPYLAYCDVMDDENQDFVNKMKTLCEKVFENPEHMSDDCTPEETAPEEPYNDGPLQDNKSPHLRKGDEPEQKQKARE